MPPAISRSVEFIADKDTCPKTPFKFFDIAAQHLCSSHKTETPVLEQTWNCRVVELPTIFSFVICCNFPIHVASSLQAVAEESLFGFMPWSPSVQRKWLPLGLNEKLESHSLLPIIPSRDCSLIFSKIVFILLHHCLGVTG